MKSILFSDLPFIVRVATGLSLMASWVVFEETVVDRDFATFEMCLPLKTIKAREPQ